MPIFNHQVHKLTRLPRLRNRQGGILTGLITLVILLWASCAQEPHISFNEDVRPIFNEKCIGCHGGVKQAGGFGLVFRENALRETTSGKFAIVPGKPHRSEILSRVRHENEELRMPFEAEPLSEVEITTLERWIEQGAEWEEHWAYLPLEAPPVPQVEDAFVADPIDAFVLTSLRQQNLAPAAAPTDRELLRRVSFDLTGLPPATHLADAFLAGTLPYPDLVDSLLASPAYGEHQAAGWLELARYADSQGYERDRPRSIWRYRDWVIKAFNEDLPYDQFIIDQLAGDLLPAPTEDQLVATGFHRNTMSNAEGGSENEEFRVAAIIDRVNTTWEVFQGTTMGCVQCHAHPYDPIRHEEYYTSYALFNNTVDHDHATEAPVLRTLYATDEAKYDRLVDYLKAEEQDAADLQRWRRLIKTREPRLRPDVFEDIQGGVFTGRADEDYLYLRPGNTFALPPQDYTDVSALHLHHSSADNGTLEVHRGSPTGPHVATYTVAAQQWMQETRIPLEGLSGEHQLYFVANGAGEDPVFVINAIGLEPRLPGDDPEEVAEITAYVMDLLRAKDSITTPILLEQSEVGRRSSAVFTGGNWLVHGQEVRGGVPKLLHGEPDREIATRLDFARWLTGPEQPLTARVAVNRVWGEVFGTALVPTVEDLGSQGAKPTHPELLDHLAAEFSGPLAWSRKALLRKIVLSGTYRQSSDATPAQLAADPYNERLARGPRKRLTAEQIRDQALAVSDLLSDKMYGPGVMPPQPDGLWDGIPYSSLKYVESTGEDRYRRAVYTYIRRSVVHPAMTTFDASNRELCLSRRTVTNTPLQALMTLNDPAYLEVARTLAEGVEEAPTVAGRIDALYHRLLARSATEAERGILLELYRSALADGNADPTDALTVVANSLLNLDEFLTIS